MNDQMLYDRLARTDAYAPELPVSDETWTPVVAFAEIERRLDMSTQLKPQPTEPPAAPRRSWIPAIAAFAVVIVIGLVVALAFTQNDAPPAEETPPTTDALSVTTTIAPVASPETVGAAIDEYLAAVNDGDADRALAPFALTSEDGRSVTFGAPGPQDIVQRNLAEYLAVLDWTYTRDADTCVAESYEPGFVDTECDVVVDSPLHAALGLGGQSVSRSHTTDVIMMGHNGEQPFRVFLFVEADVANAITGWTTENDREGFTANCDAGADGNYDTPYADYGRWIYTARCAEYLNSITDQVVALITESG